MNDAFESGVPQGSGTMGAWGRRQQGGALDTRPAAQCSAWIDFQTDAAGRLVRLSPSWTEVLGHDVQKSLGTPLLAYVHPDDRAGGERLMRPEAQVPHGHRRCEMRFLALDGAVCWMDAFVGPTLDGHGAVVGASGILRDVAPCRRAEERLRLLSKVLDGSREGVVITDPRGTIVEVNEAFVALTGFARDQILGRNPSMFSSGRHDRDFFRAMWEDLRTTGQWSGEVWNRHANGELIAEMLRISAVHSDRGEHTHFVAIYSDVTLQKRQQEKLAWLAHYDALTGLPNRVLALDRLRVLMAAADRNATQVAVCYLDLDGFMAINEQLGHAQGDALLLAVAERMRHCVRGCDTVARLGGDEFVLLLGTLDGVVAAHVTVERVLQALAQPFALSVPVPRMTASVGVALYPGHGDTPERLLRAADQAMYRAKRRGRARACMAGDGVDRPPAQEVLLEEMRAALASDQLHLYYQPKVSARTRRVLGAEALVRWQHPRRGLLAPGEFLPALAGTPLEVALDLWVVRKAVAQLAGWRAAGRGLSLSINVSPATLVLPELADKVVEIVREAVPDRVIPLEGIELEVLETAALVDMDAASRAIDACARHGISFALDDFGTGYSALSYLRKLRVNTLKIDRSFVSNMLTDSSDLHIVRAVIGLAKAFCIATVAEGVETEEQALKLAEIGCDVLQGFGIARPMPASRLEAWLDEFEHEQAVSWAVVPQAEQFSAGVHQTKK